MPALDPRIVPRDLDPPRPRGQRMAALCAVALIILSCGLLQSLSQGARPVQTVGWVFGPAPAAAADRF